MALLGGDGRVLFYMDVTLYQLLAPLTWPLPCASHPTPPILSGFEVLGLDIMLDEELRPWLIECNHSSSFNIDSPLDLAIKEALITDTFEVVRWVARHVLLTG